LGMLFGAVARVGRVSYAVGVVGVVIVEVVNTVQSAETTGLLMIDADCEHVHRRVN